MGIIDAFANTRLRKSTEGISQSHNPKVTTVLILFFNNTSFLLVNEMT